VLAGHHPAARLPLARKRPHVAPPPPKNVCEPPAQTQVPAMKPLTSNRLPKKSKTLEISDPFLAIPRPTLANSHPTLVQIWKSLAISQRLGTPSPQSPVPQSTSLHASNPSNASTPLPSYHRLTASLPHGAGAVFPGGLKPPHGGKTGSHARLLSHARRRDLLKGDPRGHRLSRLGRSGQKAHEGFRWLMKR
jgi:hypothetical protein